MDDNRISPNYFKKYMEWRKFDRYKIHTEAGYEYIIPEESAQQDFYNPFAIVENDLDNEAETIEHELISDILKDLYDISFAFDGEDYCGRLSEAYYTLAIKQRKKIQAEILGFVNKYGLLGLINDYSDKINFLSEPPMDIKEVKQLFRADSNVKYDERKQTASYVTMMMHFKLGDVYSNGHRLKNNVNFASEDECIDEMIERILKPKHFYPTVKGFNNDQPVNDHSKYAEPVHVFLKACDEIYRFFKYCMFYKDNNYTPQDNFVPLFGEKVFNSSGVKETYTWEDYFGMFYSNKCHIRSVFEKGRWQIRYIPDTLFSAICLYSMFYITTTKQVVIVCSNCGRISIVGSEEAKYCSTVCREARNSRESHRRKVMIEKDESYTSEVENEAIIRIPDKILNEAGLKQSDKITWSYSQKTGKITLSNKK